MTVRPKEERGDASMPKQIPVWLSILIAAVSVIITVAISLGADRINVGATLSQLEVRVKMLEDSRVESRSMHAEILGTLREMAGKISDNAVALQQIKDRQQEVRRKLNIH